MVSLKHLYIHNGRNLEKMNIAKNIKKPKIAASLKKKQVMVLDVTKLS